MRRDTIFPDFIVFFSVCPLFPRALPVFFGLCLRLCLLRLCLRLCLHSQNHAPQILSPIENRKPTKRGSGGIENRKLKNLFNLAGRGVWLHPGQTPPPASYTAMLEPCGCHQTPRILPRGRPKSGTPRGPGRERKRPARLFGKS